MDIIGNLLGGPQPLNLLKKHLEIVMRCIDMVLPLLDASLEGDQDRVKKLAKEVFQLEHEADEVKNNIRDNLPRELMMPVARHDFLMHLKKQDNLADKVEDFAMMLTVRKLELPKTCETGDCGILLRGLAEDSVKSARKVVDLMANFEEFQKRGFKGKVLDKIRDNATEIGRLEWEADKHQYKLLRSVLEVDDPQWPFAQSYVLLGVIKALGSLADHAEGMADTLRLMIAE